MLDDLGDGGELDDMQEMMDGMQLRMNSRRPTSAAAHVAKPPRHPSTARQTSPRSDAKRDSKRDSKATRGFGKTGPRHS